MTSKGFNSIEEPDQLNILVYYYWARFPYRPP